MKLMKNYFTITNLGYRIVWSLVFPIIIAALVNMLSPLMIFLPGGFTLAITSGVNLLLMTEVLCDFYGFGCICKKGDLGMEYLHTSFYGDRLLLDGITGDMLVRIVRAIGYTLLANIVNIALGASPVFILFVGLLLSILSVGALNATRYFDFMQYYVFLLIPLGAIAVVIVKVFIHMPAVVIVIATIVEAILLIGVLLITRWHMAKKIKDSYIDNK